jgi:hypothetical protein
MSLVRSRTVTFILSLVCLVLLYIALSGNTLGGVGREEVSGRRVTKKLNEEVIGKRQTNKDKEVVGGREKMNKFYGRNERIRSKFKTSLAKIKSTCSKYSASSNSSMTRLPPSKHFSLGWYVELSHKQIL